MLYKIKIGTKILHTSVEMHIFICSKYIHFCIFDSIQTFSIIFIPISNFDDDKNGENSKNIRKKLGKWN